MNEESAWIRDLVYLAFPEGEARERVLIDLFKLFSTMDPEDSGRLRYQLSVLSRIRRPYRTWMQRGIEHMLGCCIAFDWLLQM